MWDGANLRRQLRIARLLQELGAHEPALQHITRALVHFEDAYGPEHYKTGAVYVFLSALLLCCSSSRFVCFPLPDMMLFG